MAHFTTFCKYQQGKKEEIRRKPHVVEPFNQKENDQVVVLLFAPNSKQSS
jgi:hypothetical protein